MTIGASSRRYLCASRTRKPEKLAAVIFCVFNGFQVLGINQLLPFAGTPNDGINPLRGISRDFNRWEVSLNFFAFIFLSRGNLGNLLHDRRSTLTFFYGPSWFAVQNLVIVEP